MEKRDLRRSVILPLATLGLLASACGGGETPANPTTSSSSPSAAQSSAGATTVNATEKDFSITLDPTHVAGGPIEFAITNDGPSTHEFVVFKTNLAPDKLPLKNGSVDEEGAGLKSVDEKEDIAPGTNTTLDAFLPPGNYVIVCNIPGHYNLGMRVGLTVRL